MYVKEDMNPKEMWKDSDGRMLAIEITVEQKKCYWWVCMPQMVQKNPSF